MSVALTFTLMDLCRSLLFFVVVVVGVVVVVFIFVVVAVFGGWRVI